MQRGVLERYYASYAAGEGGGYSIDSLLNDFAWARSEYGNLWLAKKYVKGLIPTFVDLSWTGTNLFTTNSIKGYLNTVVGDQTNLVETSPGQYANMDTYTVTGLCAWLRIPTNYFEYIPVLDVKGLGPFTNDAACDYAHGWTNATTAKGGTGFPTGRTKWYTSDYGKQHIPAILNRLTVIQNRKLTYADIDYGIYSEWGGQWASQNETNYWDGTGTATGGWDSAVSIANTNLSKLQDWWNEPRHTYNGALEYPSAIPQWTAVNQANYAYWKTRFTMSSNTPAIPWSAYVWFEPWGFSTTNETVDGFGYTNREINVYSFDPNNNLYVSYAGSTNPIYGAPSNVWFELPGSIAGESVTNGALGNHDFYSDAILGPNPYDVANVCAEPTRVLDVVTGVTVRTTWYDQHQGWDI